MPAAMQGVDPEAARAPRADDPRQPPPTGGDATPAPTRWGAPSLVALAAGAVAFAAYAATAARTITWWDGASYPLAARTLGVTSPPGSLLLTLVGWVGTLVPVVRPVAFQLNLIAALIAALTVVLVTRVAIAIATPEGRAPRGAEIVGGAVAGLAFAFASTPWTYATQFTPYGLSACFTALLLTAAWAWWRKAAAGNHLPGLFVLALLFGLDFSVHRTNVLLIPGMLAWIAVRRSTALVRPATWATLAAGLAIGLAFQMLLIPLSLREPALDLGETRSLASLWSYISLEQQGGGFLVKLWPRHADWWGTQLADWGGFLKSNLGAPLFGPALLLIAGIGLGLRNAPQRALALLALGLSAGLGAVAYFNLPENYFRSIHRHYLPSLVVVVPFVALGAAALIRAAGRYPRLAPAVAAALLLVPGAAWWSHRGRCDLSHTRYAETWSRDLLEPLPANAILLTNGDNDTFPLWYLQHVEGVRTDVSVVNLSMLHTEWFPRQLRRRDPRFAGWYVGEWRTHPVDPTRETDRIERIALDPRAAEDLPPGSVLPDSVAMRVQGRLYPGDVAVVELVRHNRWRRPLMISCTVPELGWLRPYARLESLAHRVVPSLDPAAWDLERARVRLTRDVRYRGLDDRRAIMDFDSRVLCTNYVAALLLLAEAQLDRGDPRGCLDTLRFLQERVPLGRLGVPADVVEPLRRQAEQARRG